MAGRGSRIALGGRGGGRGAAWTSLGKPAVSPKPFNLPSRRAEGATPLRVPVDTPYTLRAEPPLTEEEGGTRAPKPAETEGKSTEFLTHEAPRRPPRRPPYGPGGGYSSAAPPVFETFEDTYDDNYFDENEQEHQVSDPLDQYIPDEMERAPNPSPPVGRKTEEWGSRDDDFDFSAMPTFADGKTLSTYEEEKKAAFELELRAAQAEARRQQESRMRAREASDRVRSADPRGVARAPAPAFGSHATGPPVAHSVHSLPPTQGPPPTGAALGPPPAAHGPPPADHGPPPADHGPPPATLGALPAVHGPPTTAHRPPPDAHEPPQVAHRPRPPAHERPPAQTYGQAVPPPASSRLSRAAAEAAAAVAKIHAEELAHRAAQAAAATPPPSLAQASPPPPPVTHAGTPAGADTTPASTVDVDIRARMLELAEQRRRAKAREEEEERQRAQSSGAAAKLAALEAARAARLAAEAEAKRGTSEPEPNQTQPSSRDSADPTLGEWRREQVARVPPPPPRRVEPRSGVGSDGEWRRPAPAPPPPPQHSAPDGEGLPDEADLPDGWAERLDPTTGRVCYLNRRTNDLSWEPPAADKRLTGPPVSQGQRKSRDLSWRAPAARTAVEAAAPAAKAGASEDTTEANSEMETVGVARRSVQRVERHSRELEGDAPEEAVTKRIGRARAARDDTSQSTALDDAPRWEELRQRRENAPPAPAVVVPSSIEGLEVLLEGCRLSDRLSQAARWCSQHSFRSVSELCTKGDAPAFVRSLGVGDGKARLVLRRIQQWNQSTLPAEAKPLRTKGKRGGKGAVAESAPVQGLPQPPAGNHRPAEEDTPPSPMLAWVETLLDEELPPAGLPPPTGKAKGKAGASTAAWSGEAPAPILHMAKIEEESAGAVRAMEADLARRPGRRAERDLREPKYTARQDVDSERHMQRGTQRRKAAAQGSAQMKQHMDLHPVDAAERKPKGRRSDPFKAVEQPTKGQHKHPSGAADAPRYEPQHRTPRGAAPLERTQSGKRAAFDAAPSVSSTAAAAGLSGEDTAKSRREKDRERKRNQLEKRAARDAERQLIPVVGTEVLATGETPGFLSVNLTSANSVAVALDFNALTTGCAGSMTAGLSHAPSAARSDKGALLVGLDAVSGANAAVAHTAPRRERARRHRPRPPKPAA